MNPSTNDGFVKTLCGYYAEFLETDFKKERLPQRKTEYKNTEKRIISLWRIYDRTY